MAGVLIGFILSFLFFFILTRKIWVRVIKENRLRIEIHLPLLALCLQARKERKADRGEGALGARSYIRVIAGVLSKIGDCELLIKRIALPCRTEKFGALTLVSPFGYQGLVYTFIAYLKTKTKRLAIEDNAIISSPDIKEAQFYITARLYLFQFIRALMTFKRGVDEEKKRVGDRKNVRE